MTFKHKFSVHFYVNDNRKRNKGRIKYLKRGRKRKEIKNFYFIFSLQRR